MPLPSFDQLRALPTPPRMHPNGFIQLELGSRRSRLHIWLEKPMFTREVDTPIHDHIFGFDSEVLLGRLGHVIYDMEADPEGPFHLYTAGCSAQGKLGDPLVRIDDHRYRVKVEQEVWLSAGDTYTFAPYRFHESKHEGLTATIFTIHDFDESAATRIACPVGKTPDNSADKPFKRDGFAPAVLWEQIERVCKLIH
jgi:hypothetical protein